MLSAHPVRNLFEAVPSAHSTGCSQPVPAAAGAGDRTAVPEASELLLPLGNDFLHSPVVWAGWG